MSHPTVLSYSQFKTLCSSNETRRLGLIGLPVAAVLHYVILWMMDSTHEQD